MTEDRIVTTIDGNVGIIAINNPQRRNALSPADAQAIGNAVRAFDEDTAVRVVVLRGEGGHFSAGGDLKARPKGKRSVEDVRAALSRYAEAVRSIQNAHKPVIALVRGCAFGGGMGLALSCDLITVAENARLCCNFCRIGTIPELGLMLSMPQSMGMYRAKDLWFSGREISGSELYEWGVASRLFSDDEIERKTMELARTIAKTPALAVEITKSIANATNLSSLPGLLAAELQSSPFCTSTEEHKALVETFLSAKQDKPSPTASTKGKVA